MRVTTDRGTQEIGGSCIELESEGQRLVLDLRRPLWAGRDEVVALPAVAGLAQPDPTLAGVVISHAHLDHFGLSVGLTPTVPLYMGEAAHRMLREATFFTRGAVPPMPSGYLRHREPIYIGPFTVTPYLNDHSAFDAYSLLVEAAGRRLFYTGDIRAHGHKARIFAELLRRPPRDVDVLLMEGTNLRAESALDHRGPSERDVEKQVADIARCTPGMLLTCYSAQNIDRLVTLFRAAKRSDRDLVLDLYTATMAAATGLASIPQASWERVRVYLPHSQRQRVLEQQAFARTDAVRARRIYPEELCARAGELIMTFRQSMAHELDRTRCLADAHAIWSLWPGYLEEPSGLALKAFLSDREIPLSLVHSSGHAFVPDLQRLVEALHPKRVVPIHTLAGDRFEAAFPRVDRQRDGMAWSV